MTSKQKTTVDIDTAFAESPNESSDQSPLPPAKSKAAKTTKSKASSSTSLTASASVSDRLHQFGLSYEKLDQEAKKFDVLRAIFVYLAKETYCCQGCESEFEKKWLSRYAPALNRKSAVVRFEHTYKYSNKGNLY